MRRSKILIATAAVSATVLVGGCSGSESESSDSASGGGESSGAAESPSEDSGSGDDVTAAYCEELKSADEEFRALDQGDVGQLQQVVNEFDSLSQQAPPAVEGDWQTLTGSLDQLETALNDAGLKFKDLQKLSNGQIPQGVKPADLQKLSTDLQSLDSQEVQQAGDNITQHAQSECNIDITGG